MKKLSLLLVIASMLLSCEKKHDYTCIEVFDNGYTTPIVKTTTHYNWTETDMLKYVQSINRTYQNGNKIATQRATCTKK